MKLILHNYIGDLYELGLEDNPQKQWEAPNKLLNESFNRFALSDQI